ncbi:PAAR domain-containing protein [Citrobacter farmeri]|nr:PAAR domain-containing protein [Citrobacter farmeri]HEM6627826.1 PAAR domain-containing protein [Citrobacter farmeri]
MTKKLALQDDKTTSGYITSATSNFFCNGKRIAQDQDKAWCSVCKGTYPIQATAKGTLGNTTLMVQDQDRVLCQCSNHRVIASAAWFTG